MNRTWIAALAALVLSACGGGGGGGGVSEVAATTRTPLSALSQDNNPGGTRLDFRDRNYFPMGVGDHWTYDRQVGGVATGRTETRTVYAGSGGDVVISETSLGTIDSTTLRRTTEGVLEVMPLVGSAPDTVAQFVGNLLEYAEPFYPVGSTRQIVRQGNWGEDLDGDGIFESYRLEITQVLAGFETLTLPGGPLSDVAHFRTIVSLTLQPSSLKFQSGTVTTTENSWWAPGIGLVKVDRSLVDASGAVPSDAYTLVLIAGTVAGVDVVAPGSDRSVIKVPLTHNAVVFDALRNRYYASIPGSVVLNGNRIASIDPSNGAVSYASTPLGSEPFAMALSADGSALHVGLNGSGDVLKLRLPDFVELSRTRLPVSSFFGQLYAEQISVSPVDPNVVAVSMFRAGISPRHGGVALIRSGILQPLTTQDHTGSNLIAFDQSGQYVYGLNNETTEFGLRRLAVLPTGLEEQMVVSASSDFGTRSLSWSVNGLVLGNAVYRTPDLALLGTANGTSCKPHAMANRLVCGYSSSAGNSVAIVDGTTFVTLAVPVYESTTFASDRLSEIIPGPAGQVALRMNATYYNSPSDAIWLFSSAELR